MVIFDALQEAAKRLRPKHISCPPDQEVGWLEAEILMAHATGRDKSWVMAHANRTLAPAEAEAFERCVLTRLKHKPIAYILGYQPFYGRRFMVNRHTLIPRPETELLIDLLKQNAPKPKAVTLWDVGTGCGAIGITAALEFPNASVIASDRSWLALKKAEDNAYALGAEKRLRLMRGNLLSPNIARTIVRLKQPFIVLANLPYLPESDKTTLDPDVINFEPNKALFAKQNGLQLNMALLEQIRDRIAADPERILMEFDTPQSGDLRSFASSLFPEAKIVIQKDLAGRNRVLDITFPQVRKPVRA